MLEAFQALISALTALAGMFFQLPLVSGVSLGSFLLACCIMSTVISVVFAGVRAFGLIASRRSDDHD